MRTVLRSRRIVTEQGIVDGVIEIEDGKIVRIGPAAGPADLDFEDQRIIPGIIDIHNHGFGGWSMTDPAKEKDVKGFAKAVASVGVTGVLPTAKEEAFEAIADCTGQPLDGARIYGVHSEGPFWARGGENTVGEDYPLPDVAEARRLIDKAKGKMVMMAIAPELPDAEAAIRLLNQYGVIASAGHTAADYAQCERAIEVGLTQITHTFNAMRSLHHRDPGLIASALINPRLDCEMISDGYHLQLPVMKLLTLTKGPDHILCVSDSGADSGYAYPEGTVLSDGCVIRGGAMVQPDGVLAGSTCDLSDALKTLVRKMEIPLPQAVRMLSLNAARNLKLNNWGTLKPGNSCGWSFYTRDLEWVETIVDERSCLLSER